MLSHGDCPLEHQTDPNCIKPPIASFPKWATDEITCLWKMPSPNVWGRPIGFAAFECGLWGIRFGGSPIGYEGSLSCFKVQGNFLLQYSFHPQILSATQVRFLHSRPTCTVIMTSCSWSSSWSPSSHLPYSCYIDTVITNKTIIINEYKWIYMIYIIYKYITYIDKW